MIQHGKIAPQDLLLSSMSIPAIHYLIDCDSSKFCSTTVLRTFITGNPPKYSGVDCVCNSIRTVRHATLLIHHRVAIVFLPHGFVQGNRAGPSFPLVVVVMGI